MNEQSNSYGGSALRKGRQRGRRLSGAIRFDNGNGGLRFLRRLLGRFVDALASPAVASLTLFVFLMLNTLDFYVLVSLSDFDFTQTHTANSVTENDPRRVVGGEIKIQLSLLFYALGSILALVHRMAIWRFVRANPHFIAIYAMLLAGVFWSIDPAEVVRNVIQLGVGFIIAIAFAVTHRGAGYTSLCKLFLLPLFVAHAGSVALFLIEGLDYGSFVNGSRRYGGLAGHPNSLGSGAVIGTWVALMLLLDSSEKWVFRVWGAISLVVFVLTMSVTGSATALLGMVIVALITSGIRAVTLVAEKYRVPLIIGIVLVTFTVGGSLYIQRGAGEIVGELTSSVGKDSSFTGRTELWATAVSAIEAHPLRGWSMDGHATVKDNRNFDIPVIHYHNGFLDSVVAGGVLIGILLAYELWRFSVFSFRTLLVDPARAGLLVSGVILVVLNLTEYSILRPMSTIYEAYLCAWALMFVSLHWTGDDEFGRGRAPVRPRRSKGRRAFAF